MFLDALIDAGLDSLKLLPFLFLTYLFMEWLEHGAAERFENAIAKAGKAGPLIGGLLGIVLFRIYLIFVPEGGYSLLLVPLMFIGTVLLIVLCQMFWVGGVQPGGVVLCILLFNTPVDTYVSYAMNRILDTAVGVLVALFISYVFPRGWMQMWPQRLESWRRHAREAWQHTRDRHLGHRPRF